MSLFIVAGRRNREIDATDDWSRFGQRSQQQLVVHRQLAVAVDSDTIARNSLGNSGSISRLETRLPSTIDDWFRPTVLGDSVGLIGDWNGDIGDY